MRLRGLSDALKLSLSSRDLRGLVELEGFDRARTSEKQLGSLDIVDDTLFFFERKVFHVGPRCDVVGG